MDFNLLDFEVKNTTKCSCGHVFDIEDMADLRKIRQDGFYGNVVKHGSFVCCPNCKKETWLLLKQKGQTYVVLDIAVEKDVPSDVLIPDVEHQVLDNDTFMCSTCGKVCKSQAGLNSHMKIHLT